MIKLNFEFDSKDPISSRFFDWLSAFPLDKSAVKVTTSVDYVDPSSDSSVSHRVGNIIFEFTPDQEITISNNFKEKDDAQLISNTTQNTSDVQKEKSDDFTTQLTTDNNSDVSANINDFSFENRSDEIVSTEVAFESDLDESLLAAVAFSNDDENIEQEEESVQQEDNSKNKSENESSSNDISDTKQIQETENDGELDFLLDSLDEFNN